MTEQVQKPKKVYADGTRRVNHYEAELAKYPADLQDSKGNTYKGFKMVVIRDDGQQHVVKVHENVVEAKFRAGLKEQIQKVITAVKQSDDPVKVTVTEAYDAGTTYWNIQEVVVGHVGRKGLQNSNSGGNNDGGVNIVNKSYSNNDAAAGQVLNIALAVLQASGQKKISMTDIGNTAADIVPDYKTQKERIKAAMEDKPAAKPAPVAEAATTETDAPEKPADFDDDIPF